MAVSKGAELPKARMLDAVEATAHAMSTFERWATVHARDIAPNVDGKVPDHPLVTSDVDRTQIMLAAWQADRFANAPTSDVHMALGVIEELGESFDEDADAEDAVDALGDVMVYASQLCTRNRMAVRPVITLAITYLQANHSYPQPICIAGMLAHIALKHDQNIRGLGPDAAYRPRLVDALAMMISKAMEMCAIGHELQIDPMRVFLVIGGEVMGRKVGDAMIPKAPEPPSAFEIAASEERVREGAALLDGKPVENLRAAQLGAESALRAGSLEAKFEALQAGADALGEAEKVEPGDFEIARETAADILARNADPGTPQ